MAPSEDVRRGPVHHGCGVGDLRVILGRHAAQERLGPRVLRVVDDVLGVALLDDEIFSPPPSDFQTKPGDKLLVVGDNRSMEKLQDYLSRD